MFMFTSTEVNACLLSPVQFLSEQVTINMLRFSKPDSCVTQIKLVNVTFKATKLPMTFAPKVNV